NYPNPFNPSTRIAFTIGHGAPRLVTVRVYDMLGRLVRTVSPSGVEVRYGYTPGRGLLGSVTRVVDGTEFPLP
ncbi:MAG: T9SS type A sorting domain-containing protein, partial [Acidobacteriia bacterium]|nr:T9SS type A sorting domain-containing protein [Terriglobia bacterium]